MERLSRDREEGVDSGETQTDKDLVNSDCGSTGGDTSVTGMGEAERKRRRYR